LKSFLILISGKTASAITVSIFFIFFY